MEQSALMMHIACWMKPLDKGVTRSPPNLPNRQTTPCIRLIRREENIQQVPCTLVQFGIERAERDKKGYTSLANFGSKRRVWGCQKSHINCVVSGSPKHRGIKKAT